MTRRLVAGGAAAGAVGLAATGVFAWMDARQAAFSYLVAFVYWLSIVMGALVLVPVFHVSGARWAVVFRRLPEAIGGTAPLFVLLFLPVGFALRTLFSWASPPSPDLGHHAIEILEAKRAWLSPVPFFVRAGIYFAVWIAVGTLLRSRAFAARHSTISGASLPALAITISFAAVDWVMSLDPLWQSSIFGVYVFAGGFAATLAAMAVALGMRAAVFPLNADHYHSLGKLLLAFVAFWAYIAFSQLLLIWIANLPEEVHWYLVRLRTGWRPVAFALGIAHFVVPFTVLLSRDLKRSPRALALVGAWVLAAHWIDVHWLVMPVLHHEGPAFHLADLTAFVGVGGLTVAAVFFVLERTPALPAGDPELEASLRYHP